MIFSGKYHTSSSIEGLFVWGLLGVYPGGGYFQDFPYDRNEALQLIDELKQTDNKAWIDRGTRVVFIEFTIYNANLNVFCAAK